ncbi:LacI family DNA-binding transcriptional regulator [Saccharothrix sp.]|uniref:LacI family DNA-binding transcriptional regulator n=1 Tax=Saccharothrix sp. TaxID=1873460 RepID=UPI002810F5A1|nr:LacI family DNA-binding transcriptional regulator [Saccharothrix sp.]
MGYAEKRGNYWRGRYKIGPGKYGTVSDADGVTIRFDKKRDAENAADEAEAAIRNGKWRDPSAGGITFGQYVRRWYAAQDLAASTMQNYRRHIEEHLLPVFEETALRDILAADVNTWEKQEREVGYAESSIKTWRGTLHLILADAVEEGLIDTNPAARRRGRGKRSGRSKNRGPEKAVTTALGILLIAERAALLSGRDDEFVAIVTKGFTGMRWGELVGLEEDYVRSASIRVEWQLYELDTGELHRCPPKDDSHRTIDIPPWHSELLIAHLAHNGRQKACSCHGRNYVFSGHRAANGAVRQVGAKLLDVARLAGVSTGTVSAVLNRPETVREATRQLVEAAISELGYVRGGASGVLAAHWRRNGFATWLFQPAVTGWYPRKAPSPARPVPLIGNPWPGIPVRGRNAAGRADACWLPIAKGLTPHGLRHTHRTLLVELGVPEKLIDDRIGHEDGSVQGRYTHVTALMRERLMEDLTRLWEAALDARREMCPTSPVQALDWLLRAD